MSEQTPAVNTPPAAAPEGTVTPPVTSDAEKRLVELEAERNKAIEEGANWKVAFFKEKNKNKSDDPDNETEEERVARIVAAQLAEKKLVAIDAEKDALVKKLAQENSELKLAQLNKKEVPAAMGTHNESIPVTDTLVTPDQINAFKARGWTDKDIERYKKNLQRYSGR